MKQQEVRMAMENIQRLQEVVNDFLKSDLANYVLLHKLSLIDSRFTPIDRLLDEGILYIKAR